MLAPTRDLVARLNHDARRTRLAGTTPDTEVELADGNHASVSDTILTRHNDRRLGISGTDWVKNGDRWTVMHVNRDGSLRAEHTRSRLSVVLPCEYVEAHVELGYATTVHAAQGSTADVMHGIVTGVEDRQLLYTMLTRGRAENHLHLIAEATPAEADEQFLPGITEHLTAVETLDRIFGRDGAAVSATTEQTRGASPATLLHEAADRYADAVTTSARRLLGADAEDALEAAGPGPLPWLPGVPAELRDHTDWAPYLRARADRIETLADEVRRTAQVAPAIHRISDIVSDQLRDEIVVWRAANGVPDDDRTLLGPRVNDFAADRYARHIQRKIDALYPATVRRWEATIATAIGEPDRRDEHTLDLARELDRLQATGINAAQVLRRAATLRRPLPEEHRVEALAYRVQRIAANDAAIQPMTYRSSAPSRGLRL
jgi:hypothetical protein